MFKMKKRQRNILGTTATLAEKYGNAIFSAAILFLLGAGFVYAFTRGYSLHFPDERQYFAIAGNLASGKGFSLDGTSPTALFPPLYPLLIAALLKLGASIPVVRCVNYLILCGSLLTIRSILRHEGAEDARGISAFLFIAYGVLFYTAGTLYPQTLFTLVLLLLVRCALEKNAGMPAMLLFGILCAVLMLVHSTGVFIPPVAGLWMILVSPDRKKTFMKVAASALVAVACLSIWTTRNYLVFHRFIPLTTHGGDTLYIGNNPHTSLDAWYDYVNDAFYQEASQLPETEQNRYYLKKTIRFWTTHPADAAILYLRKLLEYFNYYNNLFVGREFDSLKKVIMFITYYPLLLCLVIRLLMAGRVPLTDGEKLLVAVYIASAFFHALFIPRIRFRLPYDALLIAHIGIMYHIFTCRMRGPGDASAISAGT